MNYTCPNCGSGNIQTLRMIFEGGTSTAVHNTMGVGATSGGSVGLAGAQTTTSTITTLAASVAPPAEKPKLFPTIMAVGGVALVASPLDAPLKVIGALLFVGGFLWLRSVKRWNKNELPRLLKDWEHSWLCHKCGNRFTF